MAELVETTYYRIRKGSGMRAWRITIWTKSQWVFGGVRSRAFGGLAPKLVAAVRVEFPRSMPRRARRRKLQDTLTVMLAAQELAK